jgi:hypothetical protein
MPASGTVNGIGGSQQQNRDLTSIVTEVADQTKNGSRVLVHDRHNTDQTFSTPTRNALLLARLKRVTLLVNNF